MAEKKKRQGQKKATGEIATPKPLCPNCEGYLKRCYVREKVDGKQRFVEAGWMCHTCEYIKKDQTEQVEEKEAADGTDKAEKIKKLTEEFMKTHNRLNELAEQINELENE